MTMVSRESASFIAVECPVCESADCLALLDVSGLPATVGALCSSQEQALKAPKGDLNLTFCPNCSYLWNRSYEPGRHEYVVGYEISLHFSQVYQSFLESLARRLVEAYRLRNATILEIACGTGHFLRMLCELGNNDGIGIDPVLEREGIEKLGSKDIRLIRNKFSQRYADLQCDFICCRQALHAIPNPKELVTVVRRTIGEKRRIPVYFEVVNASELLRRHSIWQLMYEYYSFFTPASLSRLFEECGFAVQAVRPCYVDDQYLQIEAVPRTEPRVDSSDSHREVCEALQSAQAFAAGFREKIAFWEDKLSGLQKEGKKIVAWGAGGRGINFLSLVQASRCVPYIVDINPNRCGGYVPGGGQKVVSPEFVKQYRPDVLLLTNPTYEHEVRKQVENMGIHCDFLIT